MVFLIFFVAHNSVEIIGVQPGQASSIVMQFDLIFYPEENTWILTENHCKMLDRLWQGNTILLWMTKQEMDKFVHLARKNMVFKVKRNSVILPEPIAKRIVHNLPLQPAALKDILVSGGLKTVLDIKKAWREKNE